jgi:hypothetical protein
MFLLVRFISERCNVHWSTTLQVAYENCALQEKPLFIVNSGANTSGIVSIS